MIQENKADLIEDPVHLQHRGEYRPHAVTGVITGRDKAGRCGRNEKAHQ